MKEFIVSNEIRLKEIGLEDVKPIFQIIDSERDYLAEWLPFVSETHELSDTMTFVKNYVEAESKEPTFAIHFKNQLVGLIGMKDTDLDNQKTEIGYWLSQKYQHIGIVTRSAAALINYIFDELNLNRIQLKAATGNFKSQQVAERLGFIREGIERDGELHERGFVDLVVFGLLKNDRIQKAEY
jgi:ribosomal-protein-serine acetyltransferase